MRMRQIKLYSTPLVLRYNISIPGTCSISTIGLLQKEPISPVEDNPDIAETSFTDDNWQQLELEAAATTKLSFVDILVAPKYAV